MLNVPVPMCPLCDIANANVNGTICRDAPLVVEPRMEAEPAVILTVVAFAPLLYDDTVVQSAPEPVLIGPASTTAHAGP